MGVVFCFTLPLLAVPWPTSPAVYLNALFVCLFLQPTPAVTVQCHRGVGFTYFYTVSKNEPSSCMHLERKGKKMTGPFLLAAVLVLLSSAEGKGAMIPALNPQQVLLLGRYAPGPNNSVLVDVEGFSASITIANASFVGVLIADTTYGGAKLGSFINTNVSLGEGLNDPNPSGNAMPNLRVATFLTSQQQVLYTMGSGGQIQDLTATYTIQLLSEWEMIADRAGTEVLAIQGFLTDGVVLAPPVRPTRRIVVLGDSLSSGVGAGFNVPSSGAACGSGVAEDDVGPTYGMLLCGNFSAECEIVAGSGITITNKGYNLPLVFPWCE